MANGSLREGAILSTGPDRLLVRLEPEEMSGDNRSCRSCLMRATCQDRKSEATEVTVLDPNAAKRRPGERVQLLYIQANSALASAILFLPSLAGLVFGGFIANRLLGEGNGIFLVGSGCGLGLGLFATFAINLFSPSLGPIISLADFAADCPE